MQSAPAVSISLRPSKLVASVCIVVWALDVGLSGVVLSYISAGIPAKTVFAAVYAGLAIWLYLSYTNLFQGRLDWDGSVWKGYDSKQTLLFAGAVTVMLDAQWIMILKSEDGVWFVVQERHHNAHDWLALRRAVFS